MQHSPYLSGTCLVMTRRDLPLLALLAVLSFLCTLALSELLPPAHVDADALTGESVVVVANRGAMP